MLTTRDLTMLAAGAFVAVFVAPWALGTAINLFGG